MAGACNDPPGPSSTHPNLLTEQEIPLVARVGSQERGNGTPAPEDAGVVFPIRVAAVDVGSNAIRFAAAEFSDPGRYTEVESQRVAIRLGHDVFLSGQLTPQAMDAAVEALGGFRGRMEALGIRHYRAVATSAVRESRNGSEFVERVREDSGIALAPITGTEEARLVWVAVRNRVPLADRKWVLVDLGGGSVEVSLMDGEGILWSESHTMGSVRLLEELSGSAEAPGRFRQLLAEYAATLTIPAAARHWNPAGLIATGGNIEALARLGGIEPDATGISTLPLGRLRALIDSLSRLSYRQRVEELGLREDRADVILPAAVVYERLGALAGADRIVVPHVGVRDGVMLDIVDDLATHRTHRDPREREVLGGALTLGRRYLFDEGHARQVTRMARSLFDHLRELHGLDEGDLRILLAAAMLHDIGQFVSYRKHHKHSFYLLSHSEVPRLSPEEMQQVALVARYHRRSEPKEEHEGYRDLGAAERERTEKLASLLRIADALDREHLQRVSDIHARVEGGDLVLTLRGNGDLLLEQWALQSKAQMFKRIFGLDLRVETPPAAGEAAP